MLKGFFKHVNLVARECWPGVFLVLTIDTTAAIAAI